MAWIVGDRTDLFRQGFRARLKVGSGLVQSWLKVGSAMAWVSWPSFGDPTDLFFQGVRARLKWVFGHGMGFLRSRRFVSRGSLLTHVVLNTHDLASCGFWMDYSRTVREMYHFFSQNRSRIIATPINSTSRRVFVSKICRFCDTFPEVNTVY